ncbi:chromo domain-containing protein [Colletotrichum tofieldiae]|nr:chromo domain-containing protein [Colletotrichum tofieldiae]
MDASGLFVTDDGPPDDDAISVNSTIEAVGKRQEDKYRRHQERNIERKRRGLQLKLWKGETKADYYLSDEDVGQDDYNTIFPPPKPIERQGNIALPEERQSKKPLGRQPWKVQPFTNGPRRQKRRQKRW